ncbi:uncharacterized protein [Macrobrachium rosenbergii]|uniref:uncharacterized protein isoform X2 n=1 Tax=Macrobrachium rosenbergii TaxID=79674 RepID=UPI0034D43C08
MNPYSPCSDCRAKRRLKVVLCTRRSTSAYYSTLRGQFAVVYHCRHRITGEEFAAKFSSRWRMGADCTADIIHEVAVCAMLKPTNRTIQLQDVFSTDTELVLVMEYAAGGDLQTLLDEDRVPYERDVISFTRQLLEGLVFIHDQNIVHLDIKPQNLVLMGEFPDCAVKLCDFEISRMLTPGREVREILGTPDYVAPEILHYEPITKKTDMWSLGVLTYVLLTGFLPFGGDSDQETFLQISRGELDFPAELFEDISPEAIDFMKRLLLRQPERRMSARECLSHPWMKKDIKRPTTLDIPPSALCTPATSANPSLPPAPVPPTSTPATPVTAATPTEIVSPTRDIGLPPFHPNTPVKQYPPFFESTSTLTSPVTAMPPVPQTPLQRQESRAYRPNLDRLKSMSKSREVLSERIQMSNLKKTISKSRERLFDVKLGLSKSRERLMGLRSFSQSVEVLSALSQLNQENAMYQSCNNICLPMIEPSDKESDIPCRMYKSLAAIDQIDDECTHKLGYFESKFAKGSEEYNDRLTRHNTNMNSFIITQDTPKAISDIGSEARLRGGGRGGRGGDVCDKRCPRHTHRQPEPQPTQKIPKVNRAERMKRDAQRRRKERKEREREEKEKQKSHTVSDPEVVTRSSIKPQEKTDGASSPVGRRGSVSHVEQRLAERHERQQERLERQEREERRGSFSSRRRGSVDIDRVNLNDKSKTSRHSINLGVSHERPRSTTPTRKSRSKKDSDEGSDVSKASSMESVEGNLDSPRTSTRRKRPTSLELPEIRIFQDDSKPESQRGDVNDNFVKQEVRADIDEAYVSLDEPSSLNRSRSMESNASNESDNTVTDLKGETRTQDIIEAIQNACIANESEPNNEKENSEIKTESEQPVEEKKTSESTEKAWEPSSNCDSASSTELPVIQEEEDTLSLKSIVPSYVRSVSTSSDIGSMISEGSEGSVDPDESLPRSPSTDTELHPDWKGRGRSLSIQPGFTTPSKNRGRSRSNSVHLEPNVSSRARPWGGICNGSIARALEKFNIKDDDMTPVGRSIQHRRMSSPGISPSAENMPPFQ